jgi:uncharacterized protein (UPF0332 family)
MAGNEPLNGKNMLENWRKSVIGLIRLAESNLKLAKSEFVAMNYKGAVDAAATSIENISRALLHCYGEKPDLNSCQEEPLRLLARRFEGNERVQFEKAIDEAVRIYRNKVVDTYLSEKNIQVQILNKVGTERIVKAAVKIVAQFRRIIDQHFATEIAELSEKCPKCSALTINIWAFEKHAIAYTCDICGHSWIQPTQ